MTEFGLPVYLFAAGAAFLAGLVDSMAGGGGVITIPALLAVGLPPHLALGTNKLQASFGSLTASWHYLRGGLVRRDHLIRGILFTALGAATGSVAVQLIPAGFLRHVIPWLLTGILVYTLLRPDLGFADRHPHMRLQLFYLTIGLALGLYDGFFGPGTGNFWTMGFVLIMGFNLKKATGHTKIMNFTSNAVSLVVFILGGKIHYGLGLTMGLMQLLGATLGSKLVLKNSFAFVRYIFLVSVAGTLGYVIYQTYF